MSSLYLVSYFVVLLLIARVNQTAPLQLNLHLTQWTQNNVNHLPFQHNCLFVNHWENEAENIHEFTPYCLSEWPSKWIIQRSTLDQKYTFAQLFARNITSEQLYSWSAPIDIVEHYQLYLNQLSTSNDTSLAAMEFINCTGQRFGPICQYSIDPMNSNSSFLSSSLNDIIYDFYLEDREKLLGQTCYDHLQCDLGFSSICIRWDDICDGIVRCINGTDEEHCGELEINECKEDEFRCRNGQCIPWSFLADNDKTYDCLDGSDEYDTYDIRARVGPVYKLEGVSCGKKSVQKFKDKSRCQYECLNHRGSTPNEYLLFLDEPKRFSSDCWSALSCYLKIIKLFNDSNCIHICEGNSCKEIIAQECPEMFFLPHGPIAFGHVYLAYTRAHLADQTKLSNQPEYICYNEQLCGGFDLNKTFVSFNNMTCRRPHDFPTQRKPCSRNDISICDCIQQINNELSNCNTIPSVNFGTCDTLTMYQCTNSSKCIPQTRLYDSIRDCDDGDDEKDYLYARDCPIKKAQFYFNCPGLNICISRKVFADGKCHCRPVTYAGCPDELFPATHPGLHISFPHICNHILQYGPLFIDGSVEDDENDCEQWPCHNIYSHCNGILDCPDGIDELDCHPPSLINCSSSSLVCFSYLTADYTCLSAEKINDGNIDCIGGFDETKLCQRFPSDGYDGRFFCYFDDALRCVPPHLLCTSESICSNADDQRFCHHLENPNIFQKNGICVSENESIRSDTEEFLCNQFKRFEGIKTTYFSLSRVTKAKSQLIKHDVKMPTPSASTNEIISLDQHYCHNHPHLRVWLNKDHNNNITMTCLCPPSHYGDRCQYQNQRVSLTIHFRAFSDSWQTPFVIIVSLIDDTDQRTVHSYEQLTYVSVPNCQTKYNIELLYATRPKNESQLYFVHLDLYDKRKLSFRGSLHLSLPFSFVPIQRVAVQLNVPYTNYDFNNCSDSSCGDHGQCVRYFDHSPNVSFCQCHEGWSGRYCHIPHDCSCASDSLCIGKLANNRSICVCPIDRWGPRCLLHHQACRSNNPCQNGGECIPTYSYMSSERLFVCICRKGYSGKVCETSPNTIILSFEADVVLPQSMLVHFIEVKRNAPPENGTIFKNIPLDRSPALINIPRSFHIAFVEFIPRQYYLIVLKDVNNQSKSTQATLRASNHCPNITQIFNDTFHHLHLLRRTKFYHLPCQNSSLQLSCFYDIGFFCLCTDFYGQRQANCFEFDHDLKRNCRGRSNCQNGAECLQDDANCPGSSLCICPRCFYGSLCQFSSSGFGLSLDAILGSYIQPHVTILHQPVIVRISLIFTVVIFVMGVLNGILSLITFINKEPRKTGCGLYLMGSSITTLLISVLPCLKFSILLTAQIIYMTNKSFLLFQCRSLDFVLRTGLFMDQWLNACVAMERAVTAIRGVNFNKRKSKTTAKHVIPALFLFVAATNIPEIVFHRLLEDESNDEIRVWCIVEYTSGAQSYNLVMNIIHFCGPFVINVFSALVVIITTARLRKTARSQSNYRTMLSEQLREHKHLLIAPVVLVILAIPRLVISFLPGCMRSSGDAWLFLIGYFISFVPPILPFFTFVVPSKVYKAEFRKTMTRYQHALHTYFSLSH